MRKKSRTIVVDEQDACLIGRALEQRLKEVSAERCLLEMVKERDLPRMIQIGACISLEIQIEDWLDQFDVEKWPVVVDYSGADDCGRLLEYGEEVVLQDGRKGRVVFSEAGNYSIAGDGFQEKVCSDNLQPVVDP